MGIERTDKWLEEHFNQPINLLKEHNVSSRGEEDKKLYHYLHSFGMYRPNRKQRKHLKV